MAHIMPPGARDDGSQNETGQTASNKGSGISSLLPRTTPSRAEQTLIKTKGPEINGETAQLGVDKKNQTVNTAQMKAATDNMSYVT